MLIVMEYGNIKLINQAALDFEAARRGDIFQVDAAKARSQTLYGFDDFIDVLRVEAQRHSIHATKRLEQRALALHNGHRSQRTNVAQAKHGRAIGNHGNGVRLHGVFISIGGVVGDFAARLGNARRIRQRQIFARFDVHLRNGVELALPLLVQTQRFCSDIHEEFPFNPRLHAANDADGPWPPKLASAIIPVATRAPRSITTSGATSAKTAHTKGPA